jgi:hypothetical protein
MSFSPLRVFSVDISAFSATCRHDARRPAFLSATCRDAADVPMPITPAGFAAACFITPLTTFQLFALAMILPPAFADVFLSFQPRFRHLQPAIRHFAFIFAAAPFQSFRFSISPSFQDARCWPPFATLHLFSADAAFFRFAAISLLMPGFRRCVSSFAVSPFIALRHASVFCHISLPH